jgi:cyclase
MPFCYGGGITSIDQIDQIFKIGVEKILINTAAYLNPRLIKEASNVAGSQSIIVSIDVKKKIFGGYDIYIRNGTIKIKEDLVDYVKKLQDLGVGEIVLTSIDREGTGKGYDLDLLNLVTNKVDIPVVAMGGAKDLNDFRKAKNLTNVSGLAAGSMFLFHGKHRAVLLSYPDYSKLKTII